MQPSISTPSFVFFRNVCTCEPGHMSKNVYSNIICSGQKLEITEIPTNKRMTSKFLFVLTMLLLYILNVQTTLTHIHMDKLKNKTLTEKSKSLKYT